MNDHLPPCPVLEDDLALLALGVLTGRERAEALDHVDQCPACAAELERLARAADALLDVVPEREPPLGFEVRVQARLGIDTPARRPAAWRRGALVAAAAAIAVVGVLAGWAMTPSTSTNALSAGERVATLWSSGVARGTVLASAGHPAWLVMAVRDTTAVGDVNCEVATAKGRWIMVGSFPLYHGSGAWSTPLPMRVASLARARLVSASGGVLASASFS